MNNSHAWCLMVKKKLGGTFKCVRNCFVGVYKKKELTALETGLKSLISKFKCASFKSPQTKLSVHCKTRPVLKDRCVIWYIIIIWNHICISFFSETAVLSYCQCKEINQRVVCIHTCVRKDDGSHIWLDVNAADITHLPLNIIHFK